MRRLIHALGLAGLLCFALLTHAGQDDDFAAAAALFQKAAGGDKSAVDEAVTRFERLAAADTPYAPTLQAYLGAAQAMQGRDAWMPWTKMRATERGLANLDRALRHLEPRHDATLLRQVPVALETRLVAATTFIALPDLFHRFDSGKALLRAALSSPAFPAAPPAVRAALHRQAALVAAKEKQTHEEAAQWRLAIAADSAGEFAAAARQRLQELGS